MVAINTSIEELYKALKEVNRLYNGNITWNRKPEHISKNRIRFTLRVRDSYGKGHRLGYSTTSKGNRRHLVSACWHVHGDFFDFLFELNSKAEIIALNRKITIDQGNWRDRNIGSRVVAYYHSEACDCN